MTVKSDTLPKKISLDTPLLSLFSLNWEITAYTIIFIIAVITRLYDLGVRVMSHDESLHTLYSWNLYAGKGYAHDPLMHGPFLFHITALMYFLFSDNDFTARLATALFGVALVVLPYWFRPWLGRWGALAASVMILISPGLLYYSRYIRHDIFISVWTVLMILAFFQFMRTRANQWLYIGAAAVASMLSTKEVAYIHGFIGFTFIGLAFMWENFSRSSRQWVTYSLVGLILLLVIVTIIFGLQAGTLTQPNPAEEGFDIGDRLGLPIAITIFLVGVLMTQLGVDRQNRPVTAAFKILALAGLWGGILVWIAIDLIGGVLLSIDSLLGMAGLDRRLFLTDWLPFEPNINLMIAIGTIVIHGVLLYIFGPRLVKSIQALWEINPQVGVLYKATLLAVIIFILLYTTFLSNIGGLVTGAVGGVTYWLGQQEVERGSQPWYYYLFLVPLYEFLPLLVGLIGGLVYLIRPKNFPAHADSETRRGQLATSPSSPTGSIWPSDGGMFVSFTIYWTLLAFVIYSWAGEKMPWLTIHMTLPAIFLAAHVIQTVLGKFDWAEARQKGGLILGGALILIIPALAALLIVVPFRGQSIQAIEETLQFILAFIVLIGLGATIWHYGRRMGLILAPQTVFATVLLVLSLLTIRFAWMFTYINYDYVNEMMVYAHASPDVKLALQQIDDISRRTVGDKMIKVAYDNDSTWPLEWYMREYPNRVYYSDTPTRDAMDAPVVIVGSANENKVKPFLGDKYIRFRYRLVWWPIEDYKNQTLQKLWQNYVSAPPPENVLTNTAEAQAARKQTIRDNRKKMWNIIFYRDFEDYELNEWPFVHRFYLYVRKDILNEVWDHRSGPVQLTQAPILDPYEGKWAETDAIKIWGSNGSGDGQFVTPRDLAVGPGGRIYVLDSGNHRVQVFDEEGNFLFKWGSAGSGPGQFHEEQPWGIVVAQDGTVYVADTWNHRIEAFTANGEFLRTFGTFANVQGDPQAEISKFWGPRDIAVDAEGKVYVTDTGNKRIQKFTPDGQFLQMWGGGGIVAGSFEEPVGIDIDSQGNFYIADTWNRRIQKFDPNFNPLDQWDVTGWESESVINKPYLAVDNQDRVFISDPESYRVVAYDSNGEILVTWGQYGQDRASFALPIGLDFDRQGNLLVADAGNNRVMKFVVPIAPPP